MVRKVFQCVPVMLHLLLQQQLLVLGVLPTGQIRVKSDIPQLNGMEQMYSTPASWAGQLSSEEAADYRQIVTSSNEPVGCDPSIGEETHGGSPFYMIAERGECSFEHKAKVAESAGASGLIIYNSPKGIYRGRQYADQDDYDCDMGMGWVPGEMKASVWSEEAESLIPKTCSHAPTCESQRCLFTNETSRERGTKVCCAWDLFIVMGPDQVMESNPSSKSMSSQRVNIPVVFVTMKIGNSLLEFSKDPNQDLVAIFSRPTPPIDMASIIIWIIAMATMYTAAEWISRREFNASQNGAVIEDNSSRKMEDENFCDNDKVEIEGRHHSEGQTSSDVDDEDTLDITPQAAFGFVILASCSLLLFFFIDLHMVILFIYVLGATLSVAIVVFYPVIQSTNLSGDSSHLNWSNGSFITALAIATLLTFIWYFNRYASWSWLLQDFMGSSICLCFLSFIRLPNLQTATILLSLAFFYDVFFVFITPYLFGSSVMMQVAEGGVKAVHHDPNFCEKYPTDYDCRDNTAPNLLVVPSIHDYRGGTCMLGLGDIILPGLLLVLVARIDMRQKGQLLICSGLFKISLLGYGVALILANQAVVFFQYGQPALLYIVPLMLLPVLCKCKAEKTLDMLWENLPPYRATNKSFDGEEIRLLTEDEFAITTATTRGVSVEEANTRVLKRGKPNNDCSYISRTNDDSQV